MYEQIEPHTPLQKMTLFCDTNTTPLHFSSVEYTG